jgi:ABC-type transport system involved in multi-copper enzyme maturation permease subunit
MNTRAVSALARGVVLESVRRKDLWVVAILGGLILFAAGALGLFGIDGLQVFVKDLAVTVLGVFGTIVAVLTSSRMLPEEIRQRTLYPLLARPISRWDLIVGKFVGAVLVTWIAFLMLAAITAFALLSFRVEFEPIMGQFLVARMMGLVVVCALCMALSAFMTPSAAATMGFVLAFGSPMIVRGLTMAYETSPVGLQWVFKGVNAALPQVHLFNLGGRAVYFDWAPIPTSILLMLAAYMAIYSLVMVMAAWLKFRRQAL